MTARYAIYYSPSDTSALGLFGATVLRRTADSPKEWINNTHTFEPYFDLERWRSYTRKPAHYGFHATIKAPFELATDYTAVDLLTEMASFAATHQKIPLTGIIPTSLSSFRALALPEQPPQLGDFASTVVRHFEPFRRELSNADVKRRQAQKLSTSQNENLLQFGYPYIFSDFQFHMTLSESLPDDENRFLPWLQTLFTNFVVDTPILDRLSLFRQVDREVPFVRIAEFKLKA